MKEKVIVIFFALFTFFCLAAIAESPAPAGDQAGEKTGNAMGFNLPVFDITVPGNGYFFSWSPNVGTTSYKISLLTGYGQIFRDNTQYVDSLLYKAGVRFDNDFFGIDSVYGKDFTKLSYAYFGVQKGLSGDVALKFPDGITAGYNAFYGNLENLSATSSRFFYQQGSVKGFKYYGLADDLSWVINLSQYRDFDSIDSAFHLGVNSSVNLALEDDFFNSRLSFGYVEHGTTGVPAQMKYDFATYAPGVTQGLITADKFVVLENKVRLFPFNYFNTMPSFLEMIYAGVLFNAGYFLPEGSLMSNGKLTYYTGASVGLLFFKSDISLSFAYCPDTKWVINFRMIQKGL